MVIKKFFFNFIIILLLISCAKEKVEKLDSTLKNPYEVYKEGLKAWEKNDYFYAHKKFAEAELLFTDPNKSAKSSVMSSYSLYAINFYDEALENILNFLKLYPVDDHAPYIHYLKAIIYYEQIGDEKKDVAPLIKADEQINFFLNKYPNSEYAVDLKFKKGLIKNQLAAKEMYVAKYYVQVQKWVPAINRLKKILKEYDDTIFVEEALHRLVEIHYHLGMVNEAKKYASTLGYNYNSSEWFKKTYKIFNKNYKKPEEKKIKKDKDFFRRIFKKISIMNE